MDTFPAHLFPQLNWRIWPVGVTIDGGAPIGGGRGQTLDWSGGGFWALSCSGISLLTPAQIRLWRALMMRLRGGTVEMVFPVPDRAQMPWENGIPLPTPLVPHSDGTSFSDGTLYAGRSIVYQLVDAVAEGASTARVRRISGGAIVGGELFSPTYADAGKRMHLIDGVYPVAGEPDQFDITFGMVTHGDLAAGAGLDFENIGFVATLVGRDGAEWPEINHPNIATADLIVAESNAYLDPDA